MNREWSSVEDALKELRRANPDAVRALRVQQKCHKALKPRPARRLLESAVVGGFCAAYLTGIALMALHMHGLL